MGQFIDGHSAFTIQSCSKLVRWLLVFISYIDQVSYTAFLSLWIRKYRVWAWNLKKQFTWIHKPTAYSTIIHAANHGWEDASGIPCSHPNQALATAPKAHAAFSYPESLSRSSLSLPSLHSDLCFPSWWSLSVTLLHSELSVWTPCSFHCIHKQLTSCYIFIDLLPISPTFPAP